MAARDGRSYFTRNIVNIELTRQAEEPSVQQVDPQFRNKIDIHNTSEGCVFKTGYDITFEGVADDCGSPITAIELSFDDGATGQLRHRRRDRR